MPYTVRRAQGFTSDCVSYINFSLHTNIIVEELYMIYSSAF